MSGFIHSLTQPGAYVAPGYRSNDDVLQESSYRMTEPYTRSGRQQDVDILWTRSNGGGILSNPSQRGFNCEDYSSQRWEWCNPPTGCHVPKVVTGTVIDSTGNLVSGATVLLFNTTTGLLVDTQTSGGGGTYRCTDPNAATCFAVAYRAGSPDTAGTTLDTITGT